MPTISIFYGIKITINYSEHNPPHFHAEYGGDKALVSIKEIEIIKGYLPKKQLSLVLAWAEIHQDELIEDWNLAMEYMPLKEIGGLQ